MQEFRITVDEQTGEFNATWPQNFILALGMLEAAHEMLMAKIRSASAPRVLGVQQVPPMINKGH